MSSDLKMVQVTIGNYRKRPVVVAAAQWNPNDPLRAGLIAGWMVSHEVNFSVKPQGLVISTLEGDMTASPGDWIIQGIEGEFYPCKPDIFDATYEAVEG